MNLEIPLLVRYLLKKAVDGHVLFVLFFALP